MNAIAAEPHSVTPSALAPLDGIHIREATPADNTALITLTRATPMAGRIALRLDRDPDFFALLRARGDFVLFVATHRDGPAARIIGCMSAAMYTTFIAGQPELTAHVGDLKVHPDFAGRRLALHLVSAIEHFLRARGIDLSFNLVADGNRKVMTIALGKHGTPIQTMLGRFFVQELLPLPFRGRHSPYTLSDATSADLPELCNLLKSFARARNFARPTTLPELEQRLATASQSPFLRILVARHDGRPVATITIADTNHLRRNVPKAFPPAVRLALPLLRLLFAPVRGIRIPRLGQPLAMLYLRYPGCADTHIAALRALVLYARSIAFSRRATFLSIGLHERDPLRAALTGLPGFTFTSRAMATSLITHNRVAGLTGTIPYEDFALV